MLKLRKWQLDCNQQCQDWFDNGNSTFLMNVAPGGGKTKASCVIAKELVEKGEIDCVIAIAPRKSVVHQWAEDFQTICERTMLPITGSDEDMTKLSGVDFAITWSSVGDTAPAFHQY